MAAADSTEPTSCRLIPLRNIRREIVAFAVVDGVDYERFGRITWRLSNGYARRHGKDRRYLHRMILGLVKGDGCFADHINGDRLDCRRKNLRVVSKAENMQNCGRNKGGSSRYRGVTRREYASGVAWIAQAQVAGKAHYLGTHATEEDAARAAAAFRKRHMTHDSGRDSPNVLSACDT